MSGPNRFVVLRLFHDNTDFENVIEIACSDDAVFLRHSLRLRESSSGRQRHEVLGLQGAKRGLRFPKWQVIANGGLLPKLPLIFDALGGDSWTVYRFLIQHHPELEGDTALSRLLRGKADQVLAAAEKTAEAFS